jgi:SNF family Na+-dependent transporter
VCLLGISVLTTYASYSKFNNNCQLDALAASIANVIASFLAGIVVFSALGYLSLQVNKNIEDVVNSDMGLSFIAYPELLGTLKYPAFFSVVFFLMIVNLGLDSGKYILPSKKIILKIFPLFFFSIRIWR